MTTDDFLQGLRSGSGVNCIFRAGDLGGMIAVYPFNGVFVLHWEEYRDEEHRNRGDYRRDEMHRFEAAEDVLAFVERSGYPASGFHS